jgi:hypothetical protein
MHDRFASKECVGDTLCALPSGMGIQSEEKEANLLYAIEAMMFIKAVRL